MKKKILTLCLAAIMCVSFAACGSNETNKTESSVEVPKETNDSKYYFKDGVMQAEDVKIEIADYKIVPAGSEGNTFSGKDEIVFYYNVTNLSGKESVSTNSWIVFLEAQQDNDPNVVNKLDIGFYFDDNVQFDATENIKKGGTVSAYIAYQLDDNTTPVILKATRGIGGEDLGEQIFNLTSE